MIFAVILAGGKGKRMRSAIPKQFIELGGKPVLIHTVEKFLLFDEINTIIVAVHKDWLAHVKDIIAKYLGPNKPIEVIPGGETRTETLLKSLEFITSNYEIDEDDIVITHDANRPFVSYRIIQDNITYCRKYGAVDTVVPATNTIVVSEDGKVIKEIPDRKNMYEGQTPQTFRVKLLYDSYKSLSKEELENLTDAAKAVVLSGKPVYMVEGDNFNIKLTIPEDFEFAKLIIRNELK